MPNAFSDFLRRTLREHRIPKGAGALVLPQNQVICRLVTLPKTQRNLTGGLHPIPGHHGDPGELLAQIHKEAVMPLSLGLGFRRVKARTAYSRQGPL